MTNAVGDLLTIFDQLSEVEKLAAFTEICKRVKREAALGEDGCGPLNDEELIRVADELFQMYDREEEVHGTGPAW